MAQVTLGGNPFPLKSEPLQEGVPAPDFHYVKDDMNDARFSDLDAPVRVIVAVPSLETPVCANETRQFNEKLGSMNGVQALVLSRDLPFSMKRFCSTEGIEGLAVGSDFRHREFADAYGVEIAEGPFAALLARAVFVVADGKIVYQELVPEIGNEPDYDAVLQAIEKAR